MPSTEPPVRSRAQRDAGGHEADGVQVGPSGALFWVGLVVGGAIMAYAVWGAVTAFDGSARTGLLRWLIGAAVVHDAILAPVVTVVGLVLAWILPRWARGPVLGALAISAVVVLFSWPALRGYGRRDANPTLLPYDYPRNVATVLALVWIAAAVVIGWRVVRSGRR